jgi:D-lyxose ketol-isomerase
LHFHWNKTEDIINRGGGKLLVQVYNSTQDEGLADTEVTLSLDGIEHHVPAGYTVVLNPRESITIPTHLYHKLWGIDDPCWWVRCRWSTTTTWTIAFTNPPAASPRSKKMQSQFTYW